MTAADVATKIKGASTAEFRGETTITIAPDALVETMTALKDEHGFDYLVDICSVDNTGSDPRFEVVYELYSLTDNIYLRVKTTASEDKPEVATLSGLWPTADWHEREAYDMMGIKFTDHPDLRRILMWEGYPYFPLRKEFPLAGKHSDEDEIAFSRPAPLAGGPFVTSPGEGGGREPRSKE